MSLARSYREGNGNPLQYSCLENPMDGGAWQAVVHGVAERLHFYFSLSCIGEGNATHSSVLAWRIPGMGEPGGLQSMELQSRTRLKRLSSSSSSSSSHKSCSIYKNNCLFVYQQQTVGNQNFLKQYANGIKMK